MIPNFRLLLALGWALIGPSLQGLPSARPAANATRPNIVLILADDLGYGDLGCYGSTRNRTPHLDRLAREGIRFTDFHSNGPMCTPTRMALITGQYQSRFGRRYETPIGNGRGIPTGVTTLAEALQSAGYATGMFGKWHVGMNAPDLPNQQGFDEFRGLLSGDLDHHTHRDRANGRIDWWHNAEIVEEHGYVTSLLTQHSIDFIQRQRDRPFFLYLPHLAIHFPWQGPTDPPHRTGPGSYEKDKWGVVPNPADVSGHVQAMVEALDESVGAIRDCLERQDLARNTLVFFTSDNGGYVSYGSSHRNISSNGPLRGQKGDVFEGGHRVPAIAWWTGRIAPAVSHDLAATFDLYPTILALAQAGLPPHDGIDLSPVLFGSGRLQERPLYWRIRDQKAVRVGSWKLVQRGAAPPQLFNLSRDIGEQGNLARVEPGRTKELHSLLMSWEAEMEKSSSHWSSTSGLER